MTTMYTTTNKGKIILRLLYYINLIAVLTNLLLFTEPCYGMLAMIILGALQLIMALCISFAFLRHLNKKTQCLMLIYWTMVAIDFIYFALYFYFLGTLGTGIYQITFFTYPMLIGCYFLYITYHINKNLNQS